MFRKLNGKVPIDRVLYEMEDLAEHVAQGGQVGWLIDDGYVVVDVDDREDADALYKMLSEHVEVVKPRKDSLDQTPKERKLKFKAYGTKHGMHFIFKTGRNQVRQGVNLHTPVGIQVDTRSSGKGYIVLPINDPDRWVEQDHDFGELSVIPKWLIPLKINTVNENFIKGAQVGGRNDALIRQVYRIKNSRLEPEDIATAIYKINDYLFDTPLTAKELHDTVLREEVLSVKLGLIENKFSHAQMGDEIMENYIIHYINGLFYMYNSGVFQECEQDLKMIMIDMYPDITRNQRNEVLDYLRVKTFRKDSDHIEQYVNTLNGLYDLKTGKHEEHTPEKAGRNQMQFSYKPDMQVIEVDEFLMNVADGNEERRDLLLQMIGYCLTKTVREQKLFFLHGATANNGKSTFLKVLQSLVGRDNYVTIGLQQLTDRFTPAQLADKTLNVQADISDSFIKDLSHIKNLTTGDEIQAERKGKDPFVLQSFAKFVFSANEMPKASKDRGWERRLMIIPFTKEFKDSDNFDIESIVHQDALDYLGTLALDYYQALYMQPPTRDRKWANYEESQHTLLQYKEDSDSALAFVNNVKIPMHNTTTFKDEDVMIVEKRVYYNQYLAYCDEGHYSPKSFIMFGKTVKEHMEEIKYRNKRYWIIDKKRVDMRKSTKPIPLGKVGS